MAGSLEREKYRSRDLGALRARYESLLKAQLGWLRPPKESFNRWLFERAARATCSPGTIEAVTDPLLPKIVEPEISPVMKREIMEDLPVKIYPPLQFLSDTDMALQYLTTYLHAALALVARLKSNPLSAREKQWEEEAKVVHLLQQAKVWVNTHTPMKTSLTMTVAKIQEVRAGSSSFLAAIAEPVVDHICKDMGEASQQAAINVAMAADGSERKRRNSSNDHPGTEGSKRARNIFERFVRACVRRVS